jgi:hypothetical protein
LIFWGEKKERKNTEIRALLSIGYGAYEGFKVNDRDHFDIIQQQAKIKNLPTGKQVDFF